jgi:membrane protein
VDQVTDVQPDDEERVRPTVRARVEAAGRDVNDRFEAAQIRYPWLALLIEFVRRWTSTNASVLAGHLAYRVFVFLLPLIVLLVGVLGYASSAGVNLEEQGDSGLRFGEAIASTMADTGTQARDGRLQLVILGGFAVLLAASGLVKALQLVFATAWGISPKTGRSRLVILGRFLPGVLVILAAVALRRWLSRSGFVLTLGSEVLGVIINAIALLGLSWVLPRRATNPIDLLPGAIVGGIGLGALHIAALVYFPNKIERASALYGTLGIALVALLYLFLLGQAIVASALVNAVWLDRHKILDEASQSR